MWFSQSKGKKFFLNFEIKNFLLGLNCLELSYFGCQWGSDHEKIAPSHYKKQVKKLPFLKWGKFQKFKFRHCAQPQLIFHGSQGTTDPSSGWGSKFIRWHIPTL